MPFSGKCRCKGLPRGLVSSASTPGPRDSSNIACYHVVAVSPLLRFISALSSAELQFVFVTALHGVPTGD